MKSIIYLLPIIALLSSCAKKAPIDPIIVIKETPKPLTANQRKQLRHPESIRKYAVGRYTDPNNQHVLHEAHDIYRVESTSKWNHLPNRSKSLARQGPKHLVKPQGSEEIERLKQNLAEERRTSRTVITANEQLKKSIEPLMKSFDHAKILTEQNAELRRQLHETKSKPSPKQQPQKAKPAAPSQSNLLEWFDSTNQQ